MKLSALRILLPLGVMLLFLLALAITLLLALGEQRTLLLSQARHDIQREVNHYTWQAERVLAIDPQLLEDDLSQLATDPRVDMALVISPQGLVMASSQYALRGRQVTEVLEDFSAQRFAQVAADRDAFISFDDSRDTLTAIMSYTAPAAGDALRSLDKGVVYIRYNLSRALVEARHQALQQRIPELFALLLIALLLAQFLRRHVTSPLGRVQEAARAMAAGDFDFTRHITPNGPEEIRELTVAFNLMSARLAEQLAKLDKQSRHTQAVVDNVIDAIITIDGRGHIASANRATERIFGYTLDEMLGNNVKMLMPEPYRSQHDGFLANYQATGIARIIGIGREVVGRRKDGSEFPMELAVSEIDYQGQPLFIGVIRDITERKRMEQMKSEFVSTVSHELRTPLTSIGGSLGLLAGGAAGELSPQASQLIQLANNNTKRLTLLINDLLDMEKIAAGKLHFDMRELDLSPLVQQALDENQGYADQNQVSFVLQDEDPKAWVRVDAQRLLQVLTNFLSNAVKFSPHGGEVTVSIAPMWERVRVTVTDRGPGIPLDFHDRIFEKFSQADSSDTRQKGGTGLGLAITKELVEQMGGRVGFDSVEGEGASFWFELPRCDEASTGEAAVIEDTDVSRILVVEDDESVASLLALMLKRAGYQTDIASTGEQALQMASSGRYAALTLDLMLPDMDGLSVLQQLRNSEITEHLPVVVVSAKVEEGRLAINGDFPAVDWLAKPIDEARLLSSVQKALPGSNGYRPRVLHVEDDAELHQLIRMMGDEVADFDVAHNLEEARAMLGLEQYAVVILDLALPDGSGWELLSQLRYLPSPPQVIILSATELNEVEAGRVEAAFVKSRTSQQELLKTLTRLVRPEGGLHG